MARHSEQQDRPSVRERTKIQGRFDLVLLLLLATVFFTISAPDEPWSWLTTTVILAACLSITMWALGARPRVVRAGLLFAGKEASGSFLPHLATRLRYQAG
jgi:hypothetical protein